MMVTPRYDGYATLCYLIYIQYEKIINIIATPYSYYKQVVWLHKGSEVEEKWTARPSPLVV